MLSTSAGVAYHSLISSMNSDAFERHDGNPWPVSLINEKDAKGTIEMKPPHVEGLVGQRVARRGTRAVAGRRRLRSSRPTATSRAAARNPK